MTQCHKKLVTQYVIMYNVKTCNTVLMGQRITIMSTVKML